MYFFSLNNPNFKVNFSQAIITGQSPDGGLFFPEKIPKLSKETIQSFVDKEYYEIAFDVLNPFLCPEIPENELLKMCQQAYNFAPELENIENFYKNTFIARMDTGPTAAFKDFAARLMAKLFEYCLKKENKNKEVNILVATSGDTGSAIASAFCGLENIKVSVLFPFAEVSPTQRKLMTTLYKNIQCYAVDGKFDDCQKIVKTAFLDPETAKLNPSSANSINIGRLLPQAVYYFYIQSRLQKILKKKELKTVFSVPSGNFGNVMGALIAKKMGLKIKKIIAATNLNKAFTDFLESKIYKPINPSINCLSNAMNVGSPNNIPRIINLFEGEMKSNFEITKNPNFRLLKNDIFAVSFDDENTKKMMKKAFLKEIILEPHGAVGMLGLESFWQEINKKEDTEEYISVLLETASPAKFPDEMKEILDYEPEKPDSIKKSNKKTEKYIQISKNYEEFKNLILQTTLKK
jgi:threonine synthase